MSPAPGTPSATETHGYTANKGALLNRLRRIEGQVRGVWDGRGRPLLH
jgi:hypothetical protein